MLAEFTDDKIPSKVWLKVSGNGFYGSNNEKPTNMDLKPKTDLVGALILPIRPPRRVRYDMSK